MAEPALTLLDRTPAMLWRPAERPARLSGHRPNTVKPVGSRERDRDRNRNRNRNRSRDKDWPGRRDFGPSLSLDVAHRGIRLRRAKGQCMCVSASAAFPARSDGVGLPWRVDGSGHPARTWRPIASTETFQRYSHRPV